MGYLPKRYGAIDIGSNAIRLLVSHVSESEDKLAVHKEAMIRVPIRLGEDVFPQWHVSHEKNKICSMQSKPFVLLMPLYFCYRVDMLSNCSYARSCKR